jgi:hypothetical protein
MNLLLYTLFIGFFTVDYLAHKVGVLPRILTWMPELLSLITMVLLFFVLVTRKDLALPWRYAGWLAAYLVIIAGGIVINELTTGVAMAGVRIYLKYLPFFLLPLVYRFSDGQMKSQLLLLLGLSLVQLPVVLWQRFVRYAYTVSGDAVGGTLGWNTSGKLSVYLCCVVAVVVAFYMKGRLSNRTLILLLPLLVVPTMLNETKVTVFLLPVALLVPVLASGVLSGAGRRALPLLAVAAVVWGGFFAVYDQLRYHQGYGVPLKEQLSDRNWWDSYLQGDLDPVVGEDKVKRFGSIRFALATVEREGKALLGVGVGNASDSFSDRMRGEYYERYRHLSPNSVSLTRIVWELGYAGVVLFGSFLLLVFRDAVKLRNSDSLAGAVALGWVAVTPVIALGFVYTNIFEFNLLSYLFWYFSAYVIASRYRAERTAEALARAGRQPLTVPMRGVAADRGTGH